MSTDLSSERPICTIKTLPREQWVAAAETAIAVHPGNRPPGHVLGMAPRHVTTPEYLALLTNCYWGKDGVRLTVGFMDGPEQALRDRLLGHMNAWSACANVAFVETGTDPQVRVSCESGDGYWSYLGTDILQVAASDPTMRLSGFTMEMPESEFHRVVRHETGHTLGFPHEHMRSELVARIDRAKAIAYFAASDGWSEQQVIQQVLTPLDNSALQATAHADPQSIMCY